MNLIRKLSKPGALFLFFYMLMFVYPYQSAWAGMIATESTTTRTAGGLDFTAKGGKRQGREVPQSLLVKPGAKHPVWKAKSIVDAERSQMIRDRLNTLLARKDIQKTLVSWGIDPAEARARLDSLSNDEILQWADSVIEQPAGGSGGEWGLVGIAVVVAFIILLITDLLGYTDMFNIH